MEALGRHSHAATGEEGLPDRGVVFMPRSGATGEEAGMFGSMSELQYLTLEKRFDEQGTPVLAVTALLFPVPPPFLGER